MSVYRTFQKCENTIKNILRTSYYLAYETKEILRKKKLYEGVIWSSEEQKEFDEYWESLLGKRISNRWHKLYQSYNGTFCKEYIPEILYTAYIEPRLNNQIYSRVFSNKILIDVLLKSDDVVTPPNYCYSDGTHYYDHNHRVIAKYKFWEIISNSGRIVLKPASGFGSGEGILFLNMVNGINQYTGENIEDIQKKLVSPEIIAQEYYKQHRDLSIVHPMSMNTIRISTYIVNGEVHYSPIVMRCGWRW